MLVCYMYVMWCKLALSSSDTPGKVSNVVYRRNYSSNSLTTLWDPLPTLDLTDVDPDIDYTVKLFMITCSANMSMDSMVVNGSSATMENLDLMQVYKAVIIARNNVREARNGPSAEMEGIMPCLWWCFIINFIIVFHRIIHVVTWIYFI